MQTLVIVIKFYLFKYYYTIMYNYTLLYKFLIVIIIKFRVHQVE